MSITTEMTAKRDWVRVWDETSETPPGNPLDEHGEPLPGQCVDFPKGGETVNGRARVIEHAILWSTVAAHVTVAYVHEGEPTSGEYGGPVIYTAGTEPAPPKKAKPTLPDVVEANINRKIDL